MSAPAGVSQRGAEEGSPLHIVFQIHHADASEPLQQKAARAIEKLATRLRGAVDATVRIAGDGAMQRVEIAMRRPRRKALVAVGTDRQVDGALTQALVALESQIAHVRAAGLRRVRRLVAGDNPDARPVRRDGPPERDAGRPLLSLTVEGGTEGALEA